MNALSACTGAWLATFVVTASAAVSISPAGDSVPENLLRIELRLDVPLTRPLDMRRVALFDEHGVSIEAPFLDVALPSRDGLTVTVLMHPGRIKTGVAPNRELGPALRAGERVTLLVDDPQLAAPIRKTWLVTVARRRVIDPGAWRYTAPRAGSRSALDVALEPPLASSARDWIAVADERGNKLAGSVRLSADETHWQFVPAAPWREGSYRLRVHPALEDAAGNRVCAPFEQQNLSRTDCDNDWQGRFDVSRSATRGQTEPTRAAAARRE